MVSDNHCEVLWHVAVVVRTDRDGQLLQKDARNHLDSERVRVRMGGGGG